MEIVKAQISKNADMVQKNSLFAFLDTKKSIYFGVTFLFFDIDDTARIITTAAPIKRNIGAYENLF